MGLMGFGCLSRTKIKCMRDSAHIRHLLLQHRRELLVPGRQIHAVRHEKLWLRGVPVGPEELVPPDGPVHERRDAREARGERRRLRRQDAVGREQFVDDSPAEEARGADDYGVVCWWWHGGMWMCLCCGVG